MKNFAYIFILVTASLLASCSSSKQTATGSKMPAVTDFQKDQSQQQAEAVEARVGMEITGMDVTCSGKLRMLRDDVVQLNLSFLGMNIGTLEFTQDTVLLVDRVSKQYVRARYTDIDALRERNIDFKVLQGLFWGENMNGRDDGQISWKYTAFDKVNRHKIPSVHEVSFKGGATEAGFNMKLSEITNNRKWSTRTQIDASKYSRRDANLLFKTLLNL